MNIKNLAIICLITAISVSCRQDDVIFIPDRIPTGKPELTSVAGFYMLNEGNMGSNKCTLDFYDMTSGDYMRNIYASVNPEVPKELGDVGNDLEIYGRRMYAVINCSNKVEVLDAATCRRIGQVDIPNCRSVAFHGGYAYVTSYAGPVEIKPDYSQLGYVAKVDTATLQVVGRCIVGYQPDGITVCGNRLYVCNSGGYRVPNYENTLSEIDLATFTETRRIPIAVNLNQVEADNHGRLWIASRGDSFDTDARLFCYDTRKDRVTAQIPVSVSSMWLHNDDLYIVGVSYSGSQLSSERTYAVINTDMGEVRTENFISDGTEKDIRIPYGVAVHPVTGDIYVTDARTYVNPGRLHCYSPDGTLKWSVRTGDIPAHFAFLGK